MVTASVLAYCVNPIDTLLRLVENKVIDFEVPRYAINPDSPDVEPYLSTYSINHVEGVAYACSDIRCRDDVFGGGSFCTEFGGQAKCSAICTHFISFNTARSSCRLSQIASYPCLKSIFKRV